MELNRRMYSELKRILGNCLWSKVLPQHLSGDTQANYKNLYSCFCDFNLNQLPTCIKFASVPKYNF